MLLDLNSAVLVDTRSNKQTEKRKFVDACARGKRTDGTLRLRAIYQFTCLQRCDAAAYPDWYSYRTAVLSKLAFCVSHILSSHNENRRRGRRN